MNSDDKAARPSRRLTRLLDRSAIGLSGLCLVHCLAFPVLAALLPALGRVLPRQWWVHPAILALAVPLALAALWRGWRHYRVLTPILLGTFGLSLMTLGVLWGDNAVVETVLTVAGGLTLATAHLINWRLFDHHAERHRH